MKAESGGKSNGTGMVRDAADEPKCVAGCSRRTSVAEDSHEFLTVADQADLGPVSF